jgi:hypothetical protein
VNLPWLTSGHLKSPVSGLIIVDEFQVLVLEILSGIRREDQGRISRGIEIFAGKVLRETVTLECGT